MIKISKFMILIALTIFLIIFTVVLFRVLKGGLKIIFNKRKVMIK